MVSASERKTVSLPSNYETVLKGRLEFVVEWKFSSSVAKYNEPKLSIRYFQTEEQQPVTGYFASNELDVTEIERCGALL